MIDRYTAELRSPTLPLASSQDVRRVQEWVTLHGFATGVDGEFGPATRTAVAAFQKATGAGLRGDGDVDAATWASLVAPLDVALVLPSVRDSFGDTICRFARAHLAQKAREVGGDNRGPWVRHYCRGQSVAWCQGFASTLWLDAARLLGIEPPIRLVAENGVMSLFVPWVVTETHRAGRFQPGDNKRPIPAGSFFFVPGGPHAYQHVGLVIADEGEAIRTIEGNTNHAGGSNGYEVAARFRRRSSCDYGVCA